MGKRINQNEPNDPVLLEEPFPYLKRCDEGLTPRDNVLSAANHDLDLNGGKTSIPKRKK